MKIPILKRDKWYWRARAYVRASEKRFKLMPEDEPAVNATADRLRAAAAKRRAKAA